MKLKTQFNYKQPKHATVKDFTAKYKLRRSPKKVVTNRTSPPLTRGRLKILIENGVTVILDHNMFNINELPKGKTLRPKNLKYK